MKLSITLPALLLCSALPPAWSGEALDLDDETTRINYSLGYQIGGDFKRQKVEMDANAVLQGIQDAMSGGEPQLPMPEMHKALSELKRKVVTEQQAQRKQSNNEHIAAGMKFMQDNAKKEGVVTTRSGLQYKVLQEGTGASPGPKDKVTVNYRGTKIDGTPFDSSFKRGKPATFQVNQVVPGWAEGVQLMKEGGKMQLFIPPKLGFRRSGPLEHKTLILEVELLSVGEPEAATEAAATAIEEKK